MRAAYGSRTRSQEHPAIAHPRCRKCGCVIRGKRSREAGLCWRDDERTYPKPKTPRVYRKCTRCNRKSLQSVCWLCLRTYRPDRRTVRPGPWSCAATAICYADQLKRWGIAVDRVVRRSDGGYYVVIKQEEVIVAGT